MEVYVYADEVDVRLHEGSFLITTTNDTLKSFFKEKNPKYKEDDFDEWINNLNRDSLIGFYDFAIKNNGITSKTYIDD